MGEPPHRHNAATATPLSPFARADCLSHARVPTGSRPACEQTALECTFKFRPRMLHCMRILNSEDLLRAKRGRQAGRFCVVPLPSPFKVLGRPWTSSANANARTAARTRLSRVRRPMARGRLEGRCAPLRELPRRCNPHVSARCFVVPLGNVVMLGSTSCITYSLPCREHLSFLLLGPCPSDAAHAASRAPMLRFDKPLQLEAHLVDVFCPAPNLHACVWTLLRRATTSCLWSPVSPSSNFVGLLSSFFMCSLPLRSWFSNGLDTTPLRSDRRIQLLRRWAMSLERHHSFRLSAGGHVLVGALRRLSAALPVLLVANELGLFALEQRPWPRRSSAPWACFPALGCSPTPPCSVSPLSSSGSGPPSR